MRRKPIASGRRLGGQQLDWLFWPLIIGHVLLIVIVVSTLFLPQEARLTVQASTRILSLQIADGEVLDGWTLLDPMPNSALFDAGSCSKPKVKLESQINGPIDVKMQTSPAGELSVFIENPTGSPRVSIGTVNCGRKPVPAESFLRLNWKPDKAALLSLPFRGHLTLGDDPASGTSSHMLLLSGTVRAEASSVPFGHGQATSESQLYLGDQLFLSSDTGSERAVAHGIVEVRALDDSGLKVMQVTAHATAAQASVKHYGQKQASGASFAPSFWAKLQAQPEWAVLLVIISVLFNLTTQLQAYLLERGLERAMPVTKEEEEPA